MVATIDFFGEAHEIGEGGSLTLGRDGDLCIDDNPYLHRRFLEFSIAEGVLWLANTGSSLSATVADSEGLVQSWLSPGARVPLLFPHSVVWFTAGPTTYEIDIELAVPTYQPTGSQSVDTGETTMGRMTLTPDQKLLIIALAEEILRRGNRGPGSIRPSAAAAERLGWTITKFNRKLDNVCEKFSRLGIRGVVSDGTRNASNRRARLVEYALASRLVIEDDLQLLPGASPR